MPVRTCWAPALTSCCLMSHSPVSSFRTSVRTTTRLGVEAGCDQELPACSSFSKALTAS